MDINATVSKLAASAAEHSETHAHSSQFLKIISQVLGAPKGSAPGDREEEIAEIEKKAKSQQEQPALCPHHRRIG
jgi:hypothetical protein